MKTSDQNDNNFEIIDYEIYKAEYFGRLLITKSSNKFWLCIDSDNIEYNLCSDELEVEEFIKIFIKGILVCLKDKKELKKLINKYLEENINLI
jgi:hypothetical protein